MGTKISFTINGAKKTVEIEGWEKAIDVLREYLDLTGTKRGCDDGSCGACTIVINNEAKKICLLPTKILENGNILTIEGLHDGKEPHPIQKALIDAGAVQCGFCIPGIVMELYVLFNKNINASEQEIKDKLAGHFCRCTGYEAIFEGAKLAQKYLKSKPR